MIDWFRSYKINSFVNDTPLCENHLLVTRNPMAHQDCQKQNKYIIHRDHILWRWCTHNPDFWLLTIFGHPKIGSNRNQFSWNQFSWLRPACSPFPPHWSSAQNRGVVGIASISAGAWNGEADNAYHTILICPTSTLRFAHISQILSISLNISAENVCKGGGASAQTSEVPSFIRDNQGIRLILRHPVSSRDGPQNQIQTTEALSSVQPFGKDSSCLI